MQNSEEQKLERLLILCVDRDNDIGKKTGIKTPIIGKKENMEAALKLLLVDPEEADANAMFEAIKIFEELERAGVNNGLYQVATIAGSELGGIAADRKLVAELNAVLKEFQSDSLILVTDGFADEDMLPLIQSRVPVTSIRRIVVKHSESIEETAAVFSKYLKMLIEDPRYSKIFLGLPGVLLIALGVLYFLAVFFRYDIGTWAWIVGLIIVGIYLFGKGYGLDKKVPVFLSHISSLPGLITGFSLMSGLLLIGISFYQAWSQIVANPNIVPNPMPSELDKLLEVIPRIIGYLISASVTIVTIGVCVIFAGRSASYLLEHDSRFWRNTTMVVICAWSWSMFKEISHILVDPSYSTSGLILSIVVGIIIILASILLVHFLGKRYRGFFAETFGNSDKNKRT
ncbi:MAG: DUF373 family protein [Candidatus Bathyarchaeia archaeon]